MLSMKSITVVKKLQGFNPTKTFAGIGSAYYYCMSILRLYSARFQLDSKLDYEEL